MSLFLHTIEIFSSFLWLPKTPTSTSFNFDIITPQWLNYLLLYFQPPLFRLFSTEFLHNVRPGYMSMYTFCFIKNYLIQTHIICQYKCSPFFIWWRWSWSHHSYRRHSFSLPYYVHQKFLHPDKNLKRAMVLLLVKGPLFWYWRTCQLFLHFISLWFETFYRKAVQQFQAFVVFKWEDKLEV